MIKFNMEVYTFLSIGNGLVKNAAFKTQSLGSKRMKTIWDMAKYIGVEMGDSTCTCAWERTMRLFFDQFKKMSQH